MCGRATGGAGPRASLRALKMFFRVALRRWLLPILSLLALPACATTQPWEREYLAKPTMVVDGQPARKALKHHVLSTREGAVGGFGGGGGGCGCN